MTNELKICNIDYNLLNVTEIEYREARVNNTSTNDLFEISMILFFNNTSLYYDICFNNFNLIESNGVKFNIYSIESVMSSTTPCIKFKVMITSIYFNGYKKHIYNKFKRNIINISKSLGKKIYSEYVPVDLFMCSYDRINNLITNVIYKNNYTRLNIKINKELMIYGDNYYINFKFKDDKLISCINKIKKSGVIILIESRAFLLKKYDSYFLDILTFVEEIHDEKILAELELTKAFTVI